MLPTLSEIRALIRDDVRKVAKWYRKHLTLPYERKNRPHTVGNFQ